MRKNIYFSIYQKIEKEVIELSTSVCFSDEQVNVYSLRLADLIIRCSIELESIAKDLSRAEFGNEPKKSSDAFIELEKRFNLSKKCLDIISPNVNFEHIFKPRFAPFDYQDKSKEDYYSIYNSIKHDRAKNINKANIYTLIRVLGALYILNLYYRNESVYLDRDRYGSKMDKSLGSDFFAFSVAPLEDIMKLSSDMGINPDSCIYKIVRRESDYGFRVTLQDNYGETNSVTLIQGTEEFQSYAKSQLGKYIKREEFFKNNPCEGLTEEALLKNTKSQKILNIESKKPFISYSAILC